MFTVLSQERAIKILGGGGKVKQSQLLEVFQEKSGCSTQGHG